MKQSSIELIEDKIKFQMKSVQMDENNGVEWSMSVIYARLNKLLQEVDQAKEMHKQEIIDATKYGNNFEQGDLICETYYKNTYETTK